MDSYQKLISDFEAAAIDRARWTHAAHLKVGFHYVSRFEIAEATQRIRKGIQRLNAANGVETTPTGGYHETMTLLYVALLADFWNRADRTLPIAELAKAAAVVFEDRKIPLEFYSRERLFGVEARMNWLPPDLRPLPIHDFPRAV